jgi:hypothetical protein
MSNIVVRLLSASVFATSFAFAGITQAQSLSDKLDLGGNVGNLNGNVQIGEPQFSGPISVPVESPQTHVDAPVDVKVPVGAAQVLPGAVSKDAVNIHGNTLQLQFQSNMPEFAPSTCGNTGMVVGLAPLPYLGFNIGFSGNYCKFLLKKDSAAAIIEFGNMLAPIKCEALQTDEVQTLLDAHKSAAEILSKKVVKSLDTLIEKKTVRCQATK